MEWPECGDQATRVLDPRNIHVCLKVFGKNIPTLWLLARPTLRVDCLAGFSVKGSANPASTSLLLLLAGDIKTNPGPRLLCVPPRSVVTLSYLNKRLTTKIRPTPNILMRDSIIGDVDKENWNVRSVSSGTPEHLL